MKRKTINKKRVTAFLLSFLLVMQQSLTYQVLASTITNGDGSAITKHPDSGNYEILPDAWNGNIGFKHFDQFKLDKGDVANFIYQWYTQNQGVSGGNVEHSYAGGNINTFVSLVNQGVEINGIVNALNSLGGNFKPDSSLLFIAPGGMVVGASGVLNVGSLSVMTPTVESFKKLKQDLGFEDLEGNATKANWAIETGRYDTEGNLVDAEYSDYIINGKKIDANLSNLDVLQAGNGAITIDGKVASRGDVTLNGGTVNIGDSAQVFAGVKSPGLNSDGTDPNILVSGPTRTAEEKATNLFNLLVNADNMNAQGNQFANDNGNIVITSNVGTTVGNNALVRNLAKQGDITITNTGASGVNIAGEVSNPNGNLTVTNSGGELLVNTTGIVKNKGTMTFINNGEGKGIKLNGEEITNEGTLLVTNETGANGLLVGGTVNNTGNATLTNTNGALNVSGDLTNTGDLTMTNSGNGGLLVSGKVTNNTGNLKFTNAGGALNIQKGANVTSNGSSLAITNNAGGNGITIAGTVNNTNGEAEIHNNDGGLLIDTTGIINSQGTKLLVDNSGSQEANIKGQINHTNTNGSVAIESYGHDLKIGDSTIKRNITSNADVTIYVDGANLKNNGVSNTLISTTEGANLNITVQDGGIGTDLGGQDGIYTGIGQNHRDLTKSINVSVDGSITAKSTGSNMNSGAVVNIASLDTDMKVNNIQSDGRVILLADSSSKGSGAYDIINASRSSTTPNVEGKGISIIASGNIGEAGNALTFRQTQGRFDTNSTNKDGNLDYNDRAAYGVDMLAINDINVKGMDAENGEKLDTNIGGLISREGTINAEFSGNTYVRETTAANEINLTTRGQNLYVENLGEVPTYGYDYYGENTNIHPDKAVLTALDLDPDWSWETDRANSTIVVKNGTIEGQGQGRPAHEQDLTLVADNGYAGGYYFNMGNNRGEIANENPANSTGHKFNPSTVVKDERTEEVAKTQTCGDKTGP